MYIKRNEVLFPVILPFSAAEESGAATDTGAQSTGTAETLDSLLSQFETSQSTETQQQTQTTTEENDNTEQQQQEENKTPSQEEKTNYAFGQMRQQITTLNGILEKVAKANDIQYNGVDDLIQKMNDDAINKMAKAQNVPVELLREMETLKQNQMVWQKQNREQAAFTGFQALTTQYGLTQDELKSFAVELDAEGKNPFVGDVNIIDEYRLKHFDDILAKQTEKAVKEALSKSGVADQHSTTPSQQKGTTSTGTGEKITTVEGLNVFLKDFPS